MNFGKSSTDKLHDSIAQRSAQVANGLEHAADKAHVAAQETLATVSDTLDTMHSATRPSIDRLAQRGAELAHKGITATREAGTRAKAAAGRYATACENYVVEQPIKSVAIAAAAGATIAALVMLSRNRARKASSRFGVSVH